MTANQCQAEATVRQYIDIANSKFNLALSYPKIKWNLRGTTAGQAFCKNWEIKLHPVLVESEADFIARTPPHEVAHLVTYSLFGIQRTSKGRVKHHGKAWKLVMRKLGLNPDRCHTYDTSEVKQRRSKLDRNFEYACSCRTIKFTSIRHRRVMMGAKYRCTRCKQIFKFVGIAA